MSAYMDTRRAERIEAIANLTAAAIFAAAVAYAVSRLTASTLASGLGAAAASFAALQILRSIAPRDISDGAKLRTNWDID